MPKPVAAFRRNTLCFLCLALALPLVSQQKYFGNFPEGADPRTVGAKVAARFVASEHLLIPSPIREVCGSGTEP